MSNLVHCGFGWNAGSGFVRRRSRHVWNMLLSFELIVKKYENILGRSRARTEPDEREKRKKNARKKRTSHRNITKRKAAALSVGLRLEFFSRTFKRSRRRLGRPVQPTEVRDGSRFYIVPRFYRPSCVKFESAIVYTIFQILTALLALLWRDVIGAYLTSANRVSSDWRQQGWSCLE